MTTMATQKASPNTYAVHRTQAMPKNSLFGTSFEIYDGESAAAELKPQSEPVQRELPAHLKPLLQTKEVLAHTRDELDRQKNVVLQSKNDLKAVESKALTFAPDLKTTQVLPAQSSRNRVDKSHQWFTKKDIEHVREINVGGLTETGSYNRDRYGRQGPIHSYSQMGDLLQPGMEFTPRQRLNVNQNGNFVLEPRLRTNITNDMEMLSSRDPKPPAPRSVVVLPPNIRHMFGTKLCDELLSDERKVDEILKEQERIKDPPRRRRREKTPDFHKTTSPEYNGLSNATRQNVFPGYTTGHKVSTTKTVYNKGVFQQRYPDPDEYRYQRDELSKWAEHNVLRERMKKAWDQPVAKKN